jgi:hypothetical protein
LGWTAWVSHLSSDHPQAVKGEDHRCPQCFPHLCAQHFLARFRDQDVISLLTAMTNDQAVRPGAIISDSAASSLLLDPVRQLSHLIEHAATLCHKRADLAISVHDSCVITTTELLSDLGQ